MMDDRATTFQRHKLKLYGIAYRMLSSAADAEDVLQDAYLRWHETDSGRVQIPEAWLTTVVTRLCIDRLRSCRSEREAYLGPWLPEPLVGQVLAPADARSELDSDLSMAFVLVLERLAPLERAAFLLHEVFDCPSPEIAGILSKTESAWRRYLGALTHGLLSINGELGLLMCVNGNPFAVISIETDGSRILAAYSVLNPDKLKNVGLIPENHY